MEALASSSASPSPCSREFVSGVGVGINGVGVGTHQSLAVVAIPRTTMVRRTKYAFAFLLRNVITSLCLVKDVECHEIKRVR